MTRKTFTILIIIAVIAQFALSGHVSLAMTQAFGNIIEDALDNMGAPDNSYDSENHFGQGGFIEAPSEKYDSVWDGGTKASFAGSGAEDDPYLIECPEQLAYLAECVKLCISEYNNEYVYYELCRDLDLNDIEWTPIGTQESPFCGHFDGNGYSISNLYVQGEKLNDRNLGLFGVCSGTVNNLHIYNAEIHAFMSTTNAGALCGWMYGTAENCGVTNSNLYYHGEFGDLATGACFGGLFGFASNPELMPILDCFATDVQTYDIPGNVGGLIGYCSVALDRCYATSRLEVYHASSVGGLVGHMEGRPSDSIFTIGTAGANQSYATTEISNRESNTELYMGGLVGLSEDASYKYCYATGIATGTACAGLGGLVGGVFGGFIEQCFSGIKLFNMQSLSAGGLVGRYKLSDNLNGGVGIADSLVFHIPVTNDPQNGMYVGMIVGRVSDEYYSVLAESIRNSCFNSGEADNVYSVSLICQTNEFGKSIANKELQKHPDVVFNVLGWNKEVWNTDDYNPWSGGYYTLSCFKG